MRHLAAVVALLLAVCLPRAAATPTRHPRGEVCSAMFLAALSRRGEVPPQAGPPPFRVTIQHPEDGYRPGDGVTVGLVVTGGRVPVRKFYLEARRAYGSRDPVGRWRPQTGSARAVCAAKGLMNSGEPSNSYIRGVWTADSYVNDVIFVAQAAFDDDVYWADVTSEPVREGAEVSASVSSSAGSSSDDSGSELSRSTRGRSRKKSKGGRSRSKGKKSKGKKSKGKKSKGKKSKGKKSKSRSGSRSRSHDHGDSHGGEEDFIWGGGSDIDRDQFYQYY